MDEREYEPVRTLDQYLDPITLYACPDCGAAVLDTHTHDAWHTHLEETTP